MTMSMKKIAYGVLIAALAAAPVYSNGSQQGGPAAGGGGGASATATPLGTYPVKTSVTLDYWLELHANIAANFTNIGDTPFGKGLLEKTGITVNFQHPPATAVAENFNLMMADPETLPDMVEYLWLTIPGGPEKAINDGLILRLNDVIDKYAPHLKAFLKAHPEYDRMVKTDDGSYYAFPFIRGADKLLYSQGLFVRKDWLNELGLAVPDTLEEWHNVLTAFKTKCAAPFTITWTNNARMFVETFGVIKGFYVSATDNRIHYGQIEPGWRTWLETMRQWYVEGLLDPDIVSVNNNQMNSKMTSGQSGAAVASVGSGMGDWTNAARKTQPSYELVALAAPVLKKGDKRVYSSTVGQPYSGQNSVAITTNAKNVEIAARFLDYGYSDAGHLYYNFGTEGVSYTMQGGKPIYTTAVTKPSNGWSFARALASYARGNMAGPFVQDEGYIEQYYALPEQAQALITFNVPEAKNYIMPPITPTQAESRTYAQIANDCNTYADEMTAKFILGTEPLNDATWNTFVSTLKGFGIDQALTIENAALDRYKKR